VEVNDNSEVKPEITPKFTRVAPEGFGSSGDVENKSKTSLVLSDGLQMRGIAWNSGTFFLYPSSKKLRKGGT
jgi:hypothetical protein